MAGLYVHIPFCESKCSYCDFASFANKKDKIESYFQALFQEIEMQAHNGKNLLFQTIYFGGGTPSFVEANYIAQTMQKLKKHFQFADNVEATIEMNPNSVTAEKLQIYKEVGFNRFSVGLQTAIDSQLKQIGRVHTLQDFHRATALLKGENFSVDCMLGLQNQRRDDIFFTLQQALQAGASHISVYALTPEKNTPIYKIYKAGLLPDSEQVAADYDAVVQFLKEQNFHRYEISNFSLMGKESKHNLIYWHAEEYLGLGLSASSYIQRRRFTNTDDLDAYIHALKNKKQAIAEHELIEIDDAKFEFCMLAFRLREGVNLHAYKARFHTDFLEDFAVPLQKNRDFLSFTADNVRIKDCYLYVQNSILVDFLQ